MYGAYEQITMDRYRTCVECGDELVPGDQAFREYSTGDYVCVTCAHEDEREDMKAEENFDILFDAEGWNPNAFVDRDRSVW